MLSNFSPFQRPAICCFCRSSLGVFVCLCVIRVLSFGNEKYVKLNYDFSFLAPPPWSSPLPTCLAARLLSYSLNSFLWEFFIYFFTFVLAKYLTACARSSDEAQKTLREIFWSGLSSLIELRLEANHIL